MHVSAKFNQETQRKYKRNKLSIQSSKLAWFIIVGLEHSGLETCMGNNSLLCKLSNHVITLRACTRDNLKAIVCHHRQISHSIELYSYLLYWSTCGHVMVCNQY